MIWLVLLLKFCRFGCWVGVFVILVVIVMCWWWFFMVCLVWIMLSIFGVCCLSCWVFVWWYGSEMLLVCLLVCCMFI